MAIYDLTKQQNVPYATTPTAPPTQTATATAGAAPYTPDPTAFAPVPPPPTGVKVGSSSAGSGGAGGFFGLRPDLSKLTDAQAQQLAYLLSNRPDAIYSIPGGHYYSTAETDPNSYAFKHPGWFDPNVDKAVANWNMGVMNILGNLPTTSGMLGSNLGGINTNLGGVGGTPTPGTTSPEGPTLFQLNPLLKYTPYAGGYAPVNKPYNPPGVMPSGIVW